METYQRIVLRHRLALPFIVLRHRLASTFILRYSGIVWPQVFVPVTTALWFRVAQTDLSRKVCRTFSFPRNTCSGASQQVPAGALRGADEFHSGLVNMRN